MTLEEAKRAVEEIENERDNPATAHYMQDALYLEFIKTASEQQGELAEIARTLLLVEDMPFSKWYS